MGKDASYTQGFSSSNEQTAGSSRTRASRGAGEQSRVAEDA